MKTSFISMIVLAFAMAGCGNSQEASTGEDSTATTENMEKKATAEDQDGWQALFDGQSTNGWHTYGKTDVTDSWKVKDSLLYLDTSMINGEKRKGGDLITNDEYDNYHLKLDWRIAKNGNSGIIFYVKEDPQYKESYNTGLEMQVLDNQGHPDAKIIKHRAGDLYDLITSSPETVKPAGEWNHAEIVADHGKLDFYLNGEKVVSTTLWDDNWKKMVAASKFKTMAAFGTFKQGKIALQDHGNAVEYKNIMIKKL